MQTSYYSEALKLAQKEFHRCTSAGEHPYPAVLDAFVPSERLSGGVDLGIMSIPMDFVVGTRTAARTNAFARNFLPLLPVGSEFATKWDNLCQAHLDEGIREPVKVYEYLNRYYVEEGNKRISVLKFFGAEAVEAHVLRVLPEARGDAETTLYFELIDFYRLSRTNFIEFTKPGSCARLQQLLGKSPGETWSDNDRAAFRAAYFSFRQAYEANGGKHLASTVGDALLAYVEVYGYQVLRQKSGAELKKSVASVWQEITLQQESTPIDVKLDPAAEKPESLLAKVLPKAEKPLRVAFIHDKDPGLSGWTFGHELGRQHVQRVFGDKIETRAYFNALDADPLEVIHEAAQDGCTVLFTTSPRLLPASLRAAVEDPKLTILNCSLNMSHRYIRTYYARMYEAKFIAGVIAGSLAGGNDVGYICDYPIFGQVAGINAFGLGVQSVNPLAKVRLEWSSVGGLDSAMARLKENGVRLVSSQDLARLRDNGHTPFGLAIVTDSGTVNLARPVWQWGVYYETILRRIQDKSFQAEAERSPRALNYYWGMSAGVVEMRYSEKLPESTRKMAEFLGRSFRAGTCEPFRGPLFDQSGRQVLDQGDVLTPDKVIDMSWLNENIVGAIPAWEDLDETAKDTVDIVGIMSSKQAE